MIQIAPNSGPNDLILDFFAGSAATAQAVAEMNLEDGGRRRFIVVQLPEKIDPDAEAFTSGYRNLAQLSRDRIRRFFASKTAKGSLDLEAEIGLGFRAFRLSTSNFRLWDASEDLEKQIDLHVQNVDPSATPEYIVFELLLKAGFPLTTKVKAKEMAGKTVFSVEDGSLLICLDKEITPALIDALADADPLQVLCLDEGFKGNDQLKANAVQTFKARAASRETEIVFRTV